MLENNHDITQWEQWNNAPLPISADDAWQEMERLLDTDSSDKVPMPFIPPTANEKDNKRPFIIWWFILLGIILTSGVWVYLKNQKTVVSFSATPYNQNEATHLNKKTDSSATIVSSKEVVATKSETVNPINDKLTDVKYDSTKTNKEVTNNKASNLISDKKKERNLIENNKPGIVNTSAQRNATSHKDNHTIEQITLAKPVARTPSINKIKSPIRKDRKF